MLYVILSFDGVFYEESCMSAICLILWVTLIDVGLLSCCMLIDIGLLLCSFRWWVLVISGVFDVNCNLGFVS